MKSSTDVGQIVEWAPFELAEGKDEAGLLAASAEFQESFLARTPGFARRELLHEEGSRNWVDLVFWESKEAAARALRAAEDSQACALYFSYMKLPEGGEHDLEAGVQFFRLSGSYMPAEVAQ